VKEGKTRDEMIGIMESDYNWRAKGCPPAPPQGGCLQYQQIDSFIAELRR
jgi:hypothetical protein